MLSRPGIHVGLCIRLEYMYKGSMLQIVRFIHLISRSDRKALEIDGQNSCQTKTLKTLVSLCSLKVLGKSVGG